MEPIVFDHCRYSDGAMIDAKGHYEEFLSKDFGEDVLEKKWEKQARDQIAAAQAAGNRKVEWWFYEKSSADFAKKTFEKAGISDQIVIHQLDYPGDAKWPYPASATWVIYAFWGPRAETPEALATRFNTLIDELAPLHPVFNNWIWVSMDEIPTSFETRRNNLAQAIAENVARSDWCSAYPDDIMDLWPCKQLYRMPWMCYIKPAWAPLITPSKTAIVEYRPNGALFMTADETFVTANPAHLAVARDIEAAVAPLNALRASEDPTA